MDFLSRPDLRELPVGKHDIDGERIYAMISKDPGRGKEGALLEAQPAKKGRRT
jgi:biofilm protein TabA